MLQRRYYSLQPYDGGQYNDSKLLLYYNINSLLSTVVALREKSRDITAVLCIATKYYVIFCKKNITCMICTLYPIGVIKLV